MSGLESNKNLAGIGSILLLFPVVSIVGIILLFVGIKGLSEYYKDDGIYRNAVWGLIFGVVALIAIAAAVPLLLLGGAFIFPLDQIGMGFGLILILALAAIVFIFYVMAAMYFRRAFNSLAQRSGEHMFETAGTLLFIGAILTIVFMIGLFLIFIAWIVSTIAFFSIRVPSQPYTYAPQPPPISTIQATRYCSNCGAPAMINDTFCSRCGTQLTPV